MNLSHNLFRRKQDKRDNGSSVHWEFGPEHAQAGPASDAYTSTFRGPGAAGRVAGVRSALERALEAWWRQGQMPPQGLLRDGLLVLEAGHDLDHAARTLLLRAALFYGRGMVTALHHQTDPERTASVMRDMLLHTVRPLSPAQIGELIRQDDQQPEWLVPLLQLLREESNQALEPRRTLALAALVYLQEEAPARAAKWKPLSAIAAPARPPIRPQSVARRSRGRRSFSNLLAILALVMLAVALGILWQERSRRAAFATEMRTIPTGTYLIGDAGDRESEQLVELKAFAIDRTEVTNRAYRRCYDAGICTWPERVTSIQRPDYFLDPSLGGYPMINVTWSQAATFCRWVDKRLPLEEEWEVAAGSALTLRRRYLFPWGDVFDPGRTNSALSTAQDTLPVGAYSPAGDSPAGITDATGNVAEWTATPADPSADSPEAYVVKGGSFLSPAEELLVSARQFVEKDRYAPWLGFRCAVTLPDQ